MPILLKGVITAEDTVANILTDAALVLGGEMTLKIRYMKLVEALSGYRNGDMMDWRPSEAQLYCIRAISDLVPLTEAEVMPQRRLLELREAVESQRKSLKKKQPDKSEEVMPNQDL